MDPGSILPTLLESLPGEEDHHVRLALIRSYLRSLENGTSSLDPAALPVLISGLAQEADPKVRGEFIRILGLAASEHEAAKQALIAQFSKETRPGLLKMIGQFVSAGDLP